MPRRVKDGRSICTELAVIPARCDVQPAVAKGQEWHTVNTRFAVRVSISGDSEQSETDLIDACFLCLMLLDFH